MPSGLIDCAVHPFVVRSDDLRRYLDEPWRERPMPRAFENRGLYSPPFASHWPEARGSHDPALLPGSDPQLVEEQLLKARNTDYVILLPMTRGLIPEARQEAAVASATNRWLADTWLSLHNHHGRFKGSIRVSPRAPIDAVHEIDRWAGHPHFVQVAIPQEAHAPYGHEQYFPIWEAAARHGLPVAVAFDGGAGAEYPPTPVGYPSHFIEVHSLSAFNGVAHLVSLVCEGVFDRLPSLVFVFANGGFDAWAPILWRLDKDWRSTRYEVPWTTRLPSEYVRDHARFVLTASEGPEDFELMQTVLDISDAAHVLMYGSHYPFWDFFDSKDAAFAIPETLRHRVLFENASLLYKLPERDAQ